MVDKAGQVTDDDNAQTSRDPNSVGSGQMQSVKNASAGMMTECWEYDNEYPFQGKMLGYKS